MTSETVRSPEYLDDFTSILKAVGADVDGHIPNCGYTNDHQICGCAAAGERLMTALDTIHARYTKPAAVHEIEWTIDGDVVHGRVLCHAPEGANCRLEGAGGCVCEAWTIERDPDGTPYHMASAFDDKGDEIEVRHNMVGGGRCNLRDWLEADTVQECHVPTSEVLAVVPIRENWEGDFYNWEVAK